MVSTRAPKYRFHEGEKVLCYEPDPTKVKVLYDSKVLGTYETKDKRGRKIIQYKIHFQGWSSSWDRKVSETYILKDTEENRQLQKDLAVKAQLQLGAYLYRKERKKRSHKSEEDATSNLGENSPKIRTRGSSEDNFSSESTFEKNDGEFPMTGDGGDECETESYCSSVESLHDDDRVVLKVSEKLKEYLEYDYDMTVKYGMQHILPARTPIVAILENFVKQSAVKLVFSSMQTENSRRRQTNLRSDKKERDFDKLLNTIALLKEVADGLRIYFDFTITDCLLYKEERDYSLNVLSEENLKNFTYVASPVGLSPDFLLSKCESCDNSDMNIGLSLFLNATGTTNNTSVSTVPSLSNNIADTAASSQSQEECHKRKLRSYRTDDSECNIENCLSNSVSTSLHINVPVTSSSCMNYVKSLQPMALNLAPQVKEFLQKVLSWQILPTNASPVPSMIFGASHLVRLIVRLPDFLNASSIADEKLKLLLQHLDTFVNYLESRKEWFGEENYFKSTKSPNYCDK